MTTPSGTGTEVPERSAPEGVRFGVVRGITYGVLAPPDEFLPQARGLGAGLVRVFLYWAQIEPTRGTYRWDAVDRLLGQLDGTEEVWITVCGSSPWGARHATDLLPPSPATDLAAYERFVRALVEHCGGRVRYWQCENEPCYPFFWDGTPEEYVTQLSTLAHAVRAVDPDAWVVLGGAPPGLVGDEVDEPEASFFHHLLDAGRDAFDLFDLHLYGDPYAVTDMIGRARALMRAAGYDRPVLVGEYNGPLLFQWPELFAELKEVLAAGAMDAANVVGDSDQFLRRSELDTPPRAAMRALYERRDALPDRLAMFLHDCAPELADRRHRIAAREMVVRNLLALAAGVPRTTCWQLGPEAPDQGDPYEFMDLLFGKFMLMRNENGRLGDRYPAGDTLALLAGQLVGVESVRRVPASREPGSPTEQDLYLFEVSRQHADPVMVVWQRREEFDGETQPAVPFGRLWPYPSVTALDALGRPVKATVDDGLVRLDITDTPVFLTR
ncbi:MAG: hypothetical protein WCA46_15555 [Actinocatenispora sp.]